MSGAFLERRFARLGNTFLDVRELPGQGARRCRSTSGASGAVGASDLPQLLLMTPLPGADRRPACVASPRARCCHGGAGASTAAEEEGSTACPSVAGTTPERSATPRARSGRTRGMPLKAALQTGVTTVMVRNLRLKLRQHQLLDELDRSGFAGLYDFVYMPCSFRSGMGKGFAFINMVSPAAADSLMRAWDQSRRLGLKETDPAITTVPADIQGAEAYLAKCQSGRIRRIHNPDYRPVVAAELQSRPAWRKLAGLAPAAAALSAGPIDGAVYGHAGA